MKIGVTGRRPDKLFGYDLSDSRWIKLKEALKQLLIDNDCTEAYTGMALGVDTVFALAVLELKDEGHDIKLHCAIPCRNHSSKWVKESVDLYNSILARADIVTLVTDEDYSPYLMQKRNRYIVDNVDMLLAVWNGDRQGGTWNCVNYARGIGREIIQITP